MIESEVLFILKKREDYSEQHYSHISLSTGVYYSASFVNDMLIESGVDSHLVIVNDNNDIDREITKYRPAKVIIEALWVVPSKFEVLVKLHPDVKWIIRLHSEIPFLANEGNAMNWIGEYVKHNNVFVGVNSLKALDDIKFYVNDIFDENKVVYLPNYYPQDYRRKRFHVSDNIIRISSFGAIRPLKNQLIQGIAAVKFAEKIGKKVNFFVNSGRYEMKGAQVYNNLVSMFEQIKADGHKLIDIAWMPREEFLDTCFMMDIAMQVSFSETFNIVGADEISQGVPLVASREIPWSSPIFDSNPNNSNSIVDALMLSYYFPQINVKLNQRSLTKYTNKARKVWLKYVRNI